VRIIKGQTSDFENYEVTVSQEQGYAWWRTPARKVVKNVLEADDATGLIIRQIENEKGEPLFTNGEEDIALSNEAKLLLLMPPIQKAFLEAGFVPKTESLYMKDVRIVNKNPTVAIAVNVEQAMEAEG
jgi:hypothetical protein